MAVEKTQVDSMNAGHVKLEVDTVKHEPKDIAIASYVPSKKYDKSVVPLIFAHGAGGSMFSEAVANFRDGFAAEHPFTCYQGNMNLKSRVASFKAVATDQTPKGAILGGRSMGARAAVICANESESKYKQLILVSYPLHTEKKGELEIRDQILLDLAADCEVLFMIGERDTMCELERLQAVRQRMACKSWLVLVKGANHGMEMKPKAATFQMGLMTGKTSATWLHDRPSDLTEGTIRWNGTEAIWSGWIERVSQDDEVADIVEERTVDESLDAQKIPHEHDDHAETSSKNSTKASGRDRTTKHIIRESDNAKLGGQQSKGTKAKRSHVNSQEEAADAISSRTRTRKQRKT